MIIAYSGRRSPTLSVPEQGRLGTRLRLLLAALRPSGVVGSAACGADLLVLETAFALGDTGSAPDANIVLPTARDAFRGDSVEPEWRMRFDSAIERARHGGGGVTSLEMAPGDEAYRRANLDILDRAARLAAPGEEVVALALASPEEGRMVEHLLLEARNRGMANLRIDPAVDLSRQARCFVAMPYRRKWDPQTRTEVDCEQVYERLLVPALESAQLNYHRADQTVDSGVVLPAMIRDLAEADLVIGDLGTHNFNVGWELGLRHLLARGATVLIAPDDAPPPFDLGAVRHLPYRRRGGRISDQEAIRFWTSLAPYLSPVRRDVVDSPVFVIMEGTTPATVPPAPGAPDPALELHRRLSEARDLRDADRITRVAVDADSLPSPHREAIRGEAGLLLVRLSRHADGATLLRPLVEADRACEHPVWHQFLAQALYRPEEATRADVDAAEGILRHLATTRFAPETQALIGAAAKRRARLETDAHRRRGALRRALDAYRIELRADLNAYYPAVNAVALATVLGVVHGDGEAAAYARQVLPLAEVSSDEALHRDSGDFWAAATRADLALLRAVLHDEPSLRAACDRYGDALALRPLPGEVESVRGQLEWLQEMGLRHPDLPEVVELLRGD